MTTLANANDIVDTIFHWHAGAGTYAQTHLGLKCITGGSSWEDLASTLKTTFVKNTSGGLLNTWRTSVTIDQIDVVSVVPGTAATYSYSFTAVTGSNETADDLLPYQDAAVVTFRTATKGRSYRGRMYLPYLSEPQQAGGVLTAGTQAAVTAFADLLQDTYGVDAVAPPWQHVIISRFLNGVERVTPIGTEVTSFVTRSAVCTQRRRRAGVGM